MQHNKSHNSHQLLGLTCVYNVTHRSRYKPGAPQQGNGTCQPGVGLPCNYSKAEWRHAIQLTEAENITISGLTVSSSGGDGIGIGGEEMTYPSAACTAAHKYPSCHTPAILQRGGCCRVSVSRNVHIKDFTATNNYRQGMSVTGAGEFTSNPPVACHF